MLFIFETQWIEFLFMIISYIINTFLFDVSSNSGVMNCCVFVFNEV
jgi:hypothetical protein